MRPLWLTVALVACSCTFDYGTLKGKTPANDAATDVLLALPDSADVPVGTGGSTGTDAGVGGTMGADAALASGGSATTGGASASGGSVGTGGAMATGGGNGTGGLVATGGAVASGGQMGSGGALGSRDAGTGGIVATGGVGMGGIVATGGTVGMGGAAGTGGFVGTGGTVGSGGATGSGGIVGAGGATVCSVTGNDCGTRACGTGSDKCGNPVTCGTCDTTQDCADSSKCMAANLIDDFSSCSGAIPAMGGRLGYWYIWDTSSTSIYPLVSGGSAGEASPPSSWLVSQCAAWIQGGEEYVTGSEDAGIGVTLDNESPFGPYNSCSYTGIEVTYGSDSPVYMRFKYGLGTVNYTLTTLSSTASTTTARVAIPSSICGQLQDVQFLPYDWTSFGISVLKLSFY